MNEQETYTSSTSADVKSDASTGKGKSTRTAIVIAVAVALAVIGVAWMTGLFGSAKSDTSETPGTTDSPAALTPEQAAMAVATVNGVDIQRGEYERTLASVKATLSPESIAMLEAGALEQSVIYDMVSMRLLLEAVEKKNIQVSEQDVQKEYDMFKESVGGEEALIEELKKVGLDDARFRENIKNELSVRRLLDQETDIEKITVTDAEIAKIYEEAKAAVPEGGQPMPPLDEVKDAARAQLTQQKSAEIINAYVETLRKGAQIEVKI